MTTLQLALATSISLLATRAAHASCSTQETAGGADICVDTHTAAPDADDNGSAGADMLVFFPKNDITQITSTTKLLVFLPGMGDRPYDYMQFESAAAAAGYLVIGLTYENTSHSPDVCGYYASCAGDFYEQTVRGDYHGIFPRLDPARNSVNWRFGQLLAWLDNNHPGPDWNQFWNFSNAYSLPTTVGWVGVAGAPGSTSTIHPALSLNGGPKWSRMTIAGHSQGGEVATWIYKNKGAFAAITFESPYATPNTTQGDGYPTDGRPYSPSGTTAKTEWGTNYGLSETPVPSNVQNTTLSNYLATFTDTDDRLFVTLDTDDIGFAPYVPYDPNNCRIDDGGYLDCSDNWAGHAMELAARHMKKLDTSSPITSEVVLHAKPTSLTSTFNVIDVVSSACGGHSAPISDGCITQQASDPSTAWFPTLWKLILARTFALPPRS